MAIAEVRRLWGKARGTSPAAIDGAAARSLAPSALAPVRLYLRDRVVDGAVDAEGERMTDLLTSRAALRVMGDTGSWVAYAREEIVAVAPPPHVSSRRLHRARRRVEFVAPPYIVTGTAHLPPGTQLQPFVLRSGRLALPVTGAWLRTEDGSIDEDLDVAIMLVPGIVMAREIIGLV